MMAPFILPCLPWWIFFACVFGVPPQPNDE
jgi:hypothetical protein